MYNFQFNLYQVDSQSIPTTRSQQRNHSIQLAKIQLECFFIYLVGKRGLKTIEKQGDKQEIKGQIVNINNLQYIYLYIKKAQKFPV